jgi:hypothetical protein
MRDTAPLAEVGPARPALFRPVLAAGNTRKLAPLSCKFRPWRDATLSADRQITQVDDVAPSLAVALLAASLMRRPSLTRRVGTVRPPPRRVSEGASLTAAGPKNRLRSLHEAFFVAFRREKLYKNGSGRNSNTRRPRRIRFCAPENATKRPRRGWITFFELRDSSPPGDDPRRTGDPTETQPHKKPNPTRNSTLIAPKGKPLWTSD